MATGDTNQKMRLLRAGAVSEARIEPTIKEEDKVEDIIYKLIVNHDISKIKTLSKIIDMKEYKEVPRRNSIHFTGEDHKGKPVDLVFTGPSKSRSNLRATVSSKQSKATSLKTVWTNMVSIAQNSPQGAQELAGKLSMTDRFNIILKHRHKLYKEMRAFKKKIMRELGMNFALNEGD